MDKIQIAGLINQAPKINQAPTIKDEVEISQPAPRKAKESSSLLTMIINQKWR
jgi:hypothetical protein